MSAGDASEAALLELIEAIRALTPQQRGRLVRRLRILGLWDAEEPVSDRDRLRVAPALGLVSRSGEGVKPEDQPVREAAQEPVDTPSEAVTVAGAEAVQPVPQAYKSTVSSKFFVSGDVDGELEARQSMAPLPGQAPEEPIGIVFDGGTRGDPALGYGSYAIRWPGLPQQVVRLRFGDEVSGPEAEYDTLIAALEATLKRLQANNAAAESAKLDIRGDSHVVLSQVRGDVEIEDAVLRLRCDRVRFLLRRFGSWRLSRYHRGADAAGQ